MLKLYIIYFENKGGCIFPNNYTYTFGCKGYPIYSLNGVIPQYCLKDTKTPIERRVDVNDPLCWIRWFCIDKNPSR